MLTRNDVYRLAARAMNDHPSFRYGQAVYNVVIKYSPDGTYYLDAEVFLNVDCYYDDNNVEAFLDACGIV